MTHMKRKLTLLLMCLILLGGAAMASSEEVETDASEEISEETEVEAEMPPEETPAAEADPSARDYINYYLMPGDSPYLEVADAAEYIYTMADESNYEQIVFSAMDWNGLSEAVQEEIDAALPEGYLALLQEAVDYAASNAGGVIGSAGYVVFFEDGTETDGVASGISVAEIIEEAGLAGAIYIPDAPADKDSVYYYRSDTLIDGLASALTANAITVKNALESYVRENGGTAMPETDEYGHTSASALPLGLYLVVETAVPEMVTTTTAPFLVSLPMTSVNSTNATDGGTRWLYDVTLYPKNLTGIPSLEKTVREAKADTGKNDGTASITDGFAHTATASGGDVVEYQIVSTLPTITSAASYLTDYTFTDTLADGLRYNGDAKIEFFTDAACTDKITTWVAGEKFTASYTAHGMTIAMTAAGLNEINTSGAVYASSVNSGYSDCTLRITYSATMNSDSSVVYGDGGNPNAVKLRWQRSSADYFDKLEDDCHVYTYGIDLTKQFSDGQGDFSKVEFIAQNETDGYYLTATLADGVYYITGHVDTESEATHFVPMDDGSLVIKGAEDDEYVLAEVRTDNRYTLLKDDIHVTISTAEGDICDCYTDTLGVTQNDSRYTHIQKHLEHKLLTASATVDEKAVTMLPDAESPNALAPLTVINTRGFDLPQTGGRGNWIYPAIGITLMVVAGAMLLMMRRKKK